MWLGYVYAIAIGNLQVEVCTPIEVLEESTTYRTVG